MDSKRRLPVLQPSSASGGGAATDEERPPWHWVAFGTIVTFAAWLPLAYGAEAFKGGVVARLVGAVDTKEQASSAARTMSEGVRGQLLAVTLVAAAVPLMVAAVVGGYVMGRWGERVGVREAGFTGVAVALVASALAWFSAGFSLEVPLVSTALAVPCAAAGGAWGVRTRRLRGGTLPP